MFRKYKNYIIKNFREWNIERCFLKTNFIIVFCPMRSGSTLLQHLLTEEKNFLTAGETKIIYKSEDDLKKLVSNVFSYNGYLGIHPKTVIDKCVDNELIENFEIINYPRLKIIFLLRTPSETISSMLRAKGFGYSDSIDSASTYYLSRVENLLFLASHLRDQSKAFFLTYDQLIENQGKTLNSLSRFLKVKKPLRAAYKLHKWTGVAGKGDLTKNIQSGIIVKSKEKNTAEFSEELKNILDNSYQNAIKTLESVCSSANG